MVISCQENRSFDHYFGYAPWIGSYGPPPDWSQPDGQGGSVQPYRFTALSTPDIGHSWAAVHGEWNGAAMNGFYTTDGVNCMGYYTAQELGYYYSLFHKFTLCVNYFCSVLGPPTPTGSTSPPAPPEASRTTTSTGSSTTRSSSTFSEARGVTWKIYNIDFDSIVNGGDNVFLFWKNWAHDPRTLATKADYLSDVKHGKLPQASFIIPSYLRQYDEHPPADISVGMRFQQQLITALRKSPAWHSSAYVLTYDEHGGYVDHVAPPAFDVYGAGIRVPTWVISPYAKRSHLEPTVYEHSSVLKFIERLFGLPTLASVNHQFDTATPGGSNNEAANGAAVGPPAPPRDGRSDTGDLMECFRF